MANKIEIINKSLSLIGMRRITSLDDDLPQARVAVATYDISLDSVLSAGLFSFSIDRRTFSLLDETPEYILDEMSYVYQYPTDVLRLIDVYPTNSKYKVEKRRIYSDTSVLQGRVVVREENTLYYFPAFVEAFCIKLAADMSYALSNDNKQGGDLLDIYERIYLPRAKSADSTQGDPEQIIADDWLLAKYGNTSL